MLVGSLATAMVALMSVTSVESADEIPVGMWCDSYGSSYARLIKITKERKGKYSAISTFNDGSSSIRSLVKKPGGLFVVADSQTGDAYLLRDRQKSLQILDNEGPISEARPIAQEADCFS